MAKQNYLYIIDPATDIPVVVGMVIERENGNELILNGDHIANSIESEELGLVTLVSGERFHAHIQQ